MSAPTAKRDTHGSLKPGQLGLNRASSWAVDLDEEEDADRPTREELSLLVRVLESTKEER